MTARKPFGLIQVISLQWNKSARGGVGARQRNTVPRQFTFSTVANEESLNGYLHVERHNFGSHDQFAGSNLRSETTRITGGFEFKGIQVSALDENSLQLRYQYSGRHWGAPDRYFINLTPGVDESEPRVLLIPNGEWGRICFNGRFTDIDTGNWWYEQHTINVALCNALDRRIFVDRPPIRELEFLADLW